MVEADIHTLYSSDFYQVLDFKCRCQDCTTSKPEYGESFCISFVRKGNFLFNVFRNSLDSYNGCVLITKPGHERTVTHIHEVPDECTIFDFKLDFFPQLMEQYGHTRFFRDEDVHSTLLRTNAETEFLHFLFWELVHGRAVNKLQADHLVMEIIHKVLGSITDYEPDLKINARLKRNHLTTIERAKEYMTGHFAEDISLMEIATYAHVSPFHFSRIFKAFTQLSPHQYLLTIRLQQAAMLLRTTILPVADVAFSSGFNSVEHFTAAFKKKFSHPPATFRENEQVPLNSRIS